MTQHTRISMLAAGAGLCLAVLASGPAHAAPPSAAERFAVCVAKIEKTPAAAYEEALSWMAESGGRYAIQCAGRAQIAMGQILEGAERLETLALSVQGGPPGERALQLSDAGNAWLLLRKADRARTAFDGALKYAPNEPDLLIDRARAHAMAQNWKLAFDDLTTALIVRPSDLLALRLRAQSALQLRNFQAAQVDIERILKIDPNNIDALVLRGDLKEARRKEALAASVPVQ